MFSSFFILILAFPWLLISYIHFTKWTPAFSLGGSVNQLNGQAEPHVIMVRVLHLFKIQVSLTEQSCLIHIFFVSWIKDFSSPSCWSLWEGYTTHSWAQNFWLPLSGTVAGAGGGGSGGRQSSTREEGPLSGFCGCLSCCCRAAGAMASCLGKGKGWKHAEEGSSWRLCQRYVPCIYTWQAVLLPPGEELCVRTPFPSPQCHKPLFSAMPCVSRAGVTQVLGGSSIEGLLLFPVLQQSWAVPAAGQVISETSGNKSVCKQINQKSYLNIYWNN